MKLSERLHPARLSLRSLFVDLPLTDFDNRLLGPLGVRLLPRLLRPPFPERGEERLDGAALDFGSFTRYRGVHANFDLSEKEADPGREGQINSFFRILTIERERRDRLPSCLRGCAEKDAPAGAEIHSGPSFFIHEFDVVNPTLALNQIAFMLEAAELLGVPLEEITLWLGKDPPQNTLEALVRKTFRVRLASELRGVHWFRELTHFPSSAWTRILPYRTGPVRRRLLSAFGVRPRARCEELRRILLISRRDYPIYWGLNALTRKISNETEIVDALRRRFPEAETEALRLEELPLAEQLRRAHESDLLIGMHGAALGFAALLPENAAVLELFSLCLTRPHYFKGFYNLSVGNRLHYRRWVNLRRGREFCSRTWADRLARKSELLRLEPRRDFTCVPPGAVLHRVETLRRCIRRGARR